MEFNQLYGQQGYSSFILKTDVYGKIQESATGQCHSDSVGVAMDFDKGIKFGFDDFTGLKDDQWIKVRNSNLSKYDIVIQASLQCYVPSSCSNIQLIGADTICNINDAYTYRLERNPGCSIPSQWLFDTSYIQPITLTDSTITVRFKQAGLGYIKSVLSTGCGNINTRKNIKIFKAGNAFSLGPDTVLCPDNNILLNAHRGFASYEWNDGSTDSTYQIAQPGKYFVKVIDSCGNIFSDTLMVSPHPPIPFDVGVDRVKCNNDTLHIDAPSGFINYSWSPSYNISSLNAQKIVINPTKDTSYFVKAELIPGCFGYDTVRVKVNHSPSIYLGNDTSFCIGKSTVLDAGVGFSAYRWSDGSSLQTLTVNKTGSYSVIGTTTDGCSSYDTMRVVSVWPLPSPALDHNNELCQSSSRILDPGAFVSYLWQDGSTSRKYNASTTGNYYVQVTDNNGCVNADTVVITTILPPPFNFLPNDTSICSYGTADLKPTGTFTSFLWSNGSSTSKITVDKPGTYWLQVRDNNGCIGKDTVVVNPKDCMVGLRVPNGFTPNKDHKNDEFRAMLFGNVKLFELTVYNRWGQIVFFTTDRYKGWDGTVAGRDQDPGVFIWMCKYQLEGDQKRIERGTVTLVR
jgi:gliding motility-associated-like protein